MSTAGLQPSRNVLAKGRVSTDSPDHVAHCCDVVCRAFDTLDSQQSALPEPILEAMGTPADLAAHAGERIRCRRLVITTGTFLRGVIHIGSQSRPAGRMPSTAASEAAASSAQAPPSATHATNAADETAALAAGRALWASADC